MGKDSELFKAAKSGNNALIERLFASYLKKANPQAGGGVSGSGSHGFGSIRHKTHPNIQDDSGYTLIHHATLQGHKDTVSLLLRCGASTTITDSSGSCSLHLAAWRGDLEIVRILVSQGPSRANVNQLNDQEDSALHLASQYGYSDIVEFLLQRHADPLQRNIKGETPLDLAAQYGHLDTVHLLISTAPEILHLQRADFSPLHLAARNGHTVVALSLINAGICVNTVCERGSALHEAAMCGKSDMVQLLLDKGIDLNLKDSSGKTVIDLLDDYTAPRAKEIKKMIEDHIAAKAQRAGSFPSSPQADKPCRVIAVAKTNITSVMEGGSALAFKKGDNIVVQGRTGPDVFLGTAHGRKGSFLVQDATFYKEKGGLLVETDHTQLFKEDCVTPVGSLATNQVAEGTMKITITSKAPYEHVPGFPSPSPPTPTGPIAMPMDQPRPLSSIAIGHAANHQPRPLSSITIGLGQPMNHPRPLSTIVNRHGAPTEVLDEKMLNELSTSAPLNRTWSEPFAKNSGAKLPRKESRLSQVSERSEKRRLSKKEKKFQLSKDDGCYSELNPIDPHDAKKEFGDTLKLNPVGPAFLSAAATAGVKNGTESGSGDDHVTTVHNVVDGKDKREAQFQGSYYVLEVGNFDPVEEPPIVSPPTSGNSVTTPTHIQAGYYMLDVQNFDGDDERSKVTMMADPKRSSSAVTYENITPPSSTPSRGSKVGSPEARLSRSPENRMVAETTTNGPTLPTTTTACGQDGVAKATVYENVIISSLGVPEPIIPVEHPYNVPPPSADLQATRGGEPPRPPRADGHGFSVGPVEDESGYTLVDDSSRRRLGPGGVVVSARLPDCYEDRKLNEEGQQSNEDGAALSSIDQDHVSSQSTKKSPSKRREEVYETIKVGGVNSSKHQPTAVSDSAHVNGHFDRGSPTYSSPSLEGTSIIDNSQDNPFAGLVISASRQLEESISSPGISPSLLAGVGRGRERGAESGGGKFRGRTDTVWDDVRMEKEWTQIDTLLRDMSLPEDADQSPSSGSPVKQSADMYQWLRGHQLSGCASALESSGFDNKDFLNGGVLAMDDIVDIGITDDGDRYNLLAAVSLLPEPPSVGHAQSVSDWLQLLCLSQLEQKFQGYTLKRVSNLWDIELASVVGVELLGYRKRLQYGIGELRRVHPEWVGQNIPSQTKAPKLPTKKRKAASTSSGPTHAQLLRADGSELSVRSPSVASGGRVPSGAWKHPNSALTEGCNYHIKYLGSLIVQRLHGQQSAEEACLKMRHTREKMQKIPDIILSISWKGVQFADASSKSVVSTHAVRDISYCSSDIEDKRVFAYITRDRKANVNYSHVFMAPTQAIAEEIRMTIGQAFEICYQKVMKAKRLSQEKRTSGGSPMSSPVHN